MSARLKKELLQLSKSKLVKRCKSEKISIYGTKGDMIKRLMSKYEKQKPEYNWKPINCLYSELLVTGYIHQIQLILENKQLIPKSIAFLCNQFFAIKTYIFFKQYVYETHKTSFGILSDENETYDMILKKWNKQEFVSSSCFIPYISHLLPNPSELKINIKNKTYHGIFSCIDEEHIYPSLFLFEPTFDRMNNTDICYEFKSKTFMKSTHGDVLGLAQVIFCDNKYGIMYENAGNLYQLKLKNIKSKSDIEFKQLDNDKYWNFPSYSGRPIQYLNMSYLINKDKIFGVHCFYTEEDIGYDDYEEERTVKCGIYDLNACKWNDIKSYVYNKEFDDLRFHCRTCYDSKINESIFMITSAMDTAKYDFNKNQWDLLCDKDIQCENDTIIWIDANNKQILHMLWSNHWGCTILKYFDLRTNDSWMLKNDLKFLQGKRLRLFT
eukprot:245233_1